MYKSLLKKYEAFWFWVNSIQNHVNSDSKCKILYCILCGSESLKKVWESNLPHDVGQRVHTIMRAKDNCNLVVWALVRKS